ncbi:hypothetical protein [Niveispirillum cyanobacteriorum]|uniref:hypothetical protein n=1 Tax=Niveispirillum cyanobacteriorum TaxID=1612173 RepID=UPI00131A2854|nr:hypothetical protein [Niveispirillum cyanobacteriorum]GGE69978.1 hypothetical protein GCM10011317_29100 [Niveispirillum cyanobacteriorum]
MQALKNILIIGAVIIAAGFAFLGYEVYKRSTDPNHPRTFSARFGMQGKAPEAEPPAAPPAPTAPAPVKAPMPTEAVTLPPGAVLLPGIAAVNGRIAVQVKLTDGRTQVLLVDPATGEHAVLVTSAP